MEIEFEIKVCSIHGHCILVDKETNGDILSLQMPLEIAEYICLCVNERDKLQKQVDLLTLGLLQEKRKTEVLLEALTAITKVRQGLYDYCIKHKIYEGVRGLNSEIIRCLIADYAISKAKGEQNDETRKTETENNPENNTEN